jgi:hypothetical protein
MVLVPPERDDRRWRDLEQRSAHYGENHNDEGEAKMLKYFYGSAGGVWFGVLVTRLSADVAPSVAGALATTMVADVLVTPLLVTLVLASGAPTGAEGFIGGVCRRRQPAVGCSSFRL